MPIGAWTTFNFASWPSGTCAPVGVGTMISRKRFEVLAEIAAVAEIDGVAFQPFDGRRQRHAAERDFEHVLHVAEA